MLTELSIIANWTSNQDDAAIVTGVRGCVVLGLVQSINPESNLSLLANRLTDRLTPKITVITNRY